MIVIKIEIWPHGDTSKARILGVGTIANTGQGTPELGRYRAFFDSIGPGGSQHREAAIGRFKRQEKDSWELLYLALKKVFGGKK